MTNPRRRARLRTQKKAMKGSVAVVPVPRAGEPPAPPPASRLSVFACKDIIQDRLADEETEAIARARGLMP